ncbi:hypothetical protein HA402_003182 [Bradysia odoriphaga]|nr:hypothetical protein HA402_003182 [Bradysia odoriphaga]
MNGQVMGAYIAQMADLNKDLTLTVQELARFINGRVRDHVDMAIKTNPHNFAAIDVSPRDGLVTWDEYHAFFLKSRGLNDEYIRNHDEKKHILLDRKTKEEMMRDKALWSEAARTDSFSLTLDEFLIFRHPESSVSNLLTLVDDLLRQFDEDGDDNLTLDEFSQVSADDLDDKWRKYIITKTMYERQEEFKRLIDTDHNGKANRSELLSYVDPRHPRHALTEAASLFNLADENNDQRLSLDEVLNHADSFIRSKVISTYENFHDEF